MRHAPLALAILASLLIPATAIAQSDALTDGVRFESSGRTVDVEVRGEGKCRTPCEMALSPGAYRLRVDGLNRDFYVATGSDLIIVQPVRYPLLVLGAVLLAGGSAGLTFASHWASPLNNEQRLYAGLGGLALSGLAIPLIIWSSAAVNDDSPRRVVATASPEKLVLSLGLAQRSGFRFAGRELRSTTGISYRFANSRLSIGARGQYAAFADDGAITVTAGPSFHLARLPIISVAVGARVGFERRTVSRDAAIEFELGKERETSGVLELTSQLRVEVPWPVKPVVNFNLEITNYDQWDARFVAAAGLQAAF